MPNWVKPAGLSVDGALDHDTNDATENDDSERRRQVLPDLERDAGPPVAFDTLAASSPTMDDLGVHARGPGNPGLTGRPYSPIAFMPASG
jgi:hypothetical protein